MCKRGSGGGTRIACAIRRSGPVDQAYAVLARGSIPRRQLGLLAAAFGFALFARHSCGSSEPPSDPCRSANEPPGLTWRQPPQDHIPPLTWPHGRPTRAASPDVPSADCSRAEGEWCVCTCCVCARLCGRLATLSKRAFTTLTYALQLDTCPPACSGCTDSSTRLSGRRATFASQSLTPNASKSVWASSW